MQKMNRSERNYYTIRLFFLAIFVLSIAYISAGAQKPKPLTKDEVNEVIRQDLERYRGLYQSEHENWAREYEAKKHVEAQLSQLRAAVAKAAKL